MATWFQTAEEKKKKEDEVPEVTPKAISESLTKTKTELEAKFASLEGKIDNHPTLKAMDDFLKIEREKAEAAQAQRQQQVQQQSDQQFENMDQTTRAYIDRTMTPLATATLMQQGNEMRRNIFEDAEAFPYYSGVLKSKIDTMLDAQPPSQRANPEVIRNVYKIVIFDNDKEIKENKVKSRLSSASSSGTGNGMSGDADPKALPVLTDQMKRVAQGMGMTAEQYAGAMKELQDAGEYA